MQTKLMPQKCLAHSQTGHWKSKSCLNVYINIILQFHCHYYYFFTLPELLCPVMVPWFIRNFLEKYQLLIGKLQQTIYIPRLFEYFFSKSFPSYFHKVWTSLSNSHSVLIKPPHLKPSYSKFKFFFFEYSCFTTFY